MRRVSCSSWLTCGESVPSSHPPELCKSRGCTSSTPLQPASTPRLACKQKEKGEGSGESRSPYGQAGRAPPAALRRAGFITGGCSRDPWLSPPTAATYTPRSRHSSEGSEFTSFVWMLSAPPPPTPTFATLTLTPAWARAVGWGRGPAPADAPRPGPARARRTPQPRLLDGRPAQAQDTHQ